MKTPPSKAKLAIAVAGLLAASFAHAGPATLDFYLFEGSTPLEDVELLIDGTEVARTGDNGGARLRSGPGEHRLVVRRADQVLLELPLTLADDEQVQVSAALYPDRAPVYRLISSAHGEQTVDLGQTDSARAQGRVLDARGEPLAGAEVSANGTTAITDAEGRFSLDTRPGRYTLSVVAVGHEAYLAAGTELNYGANELADLQLMPAAASAAAVAGDSGTTALAGIEVREAIVVDEGGQFEAAAERRESAQVSDSLSAEQISRAGDSDAASALKRAPGLTVVEGKHVYVRGLGERYSSTLLNGAQVPSPDPTRRVVPLDLFPTEVLKGMVVQKTYSANLPAEFGGGAILLRTRGVPEDFFLRTSVTLGYTDGTTGSDGLRYDGGRRDWTGEDRGTRDAPSVFGVDRLPTDPAALQAAGRELAAQGYSTRRDNLSPNGGFGLGIGDAFRFGDSDVSLGYVAALRYAHAWDDTTETRRSYSLFQGRLLPAEDFERRSTERSIDGSAFGVLGLKVGGDHAVDLTFTRLRQTTDEVKVDEGVLGSGNIDRLTTLEWIENGLDTVQLAGQHRFPQFGGLELDWQATDAEASRYAPNARSYRFTYDEGLDDFVFESFNQQRFEQLRDDASDYGFGLRKAFRIADAVDMSVHGGAARMERDRDSSIRRFRFSGRRPAGNIFDFEDLLQPGNIGPDGLRLEEGTLASDAYTASQKLDARYLMLDAHWRALRLNLGLRREDMLQTVTTVRPFDPNATPIVGLLDSTDNLPSGALTWAYSDRAQVRLAYSTTLSRPDIREQSPANFVDPLLDVRVQGNPNLKQAEIENIDLRWEYYFSNLESFSVALFSKKFDNPIELVSTPASGELLALDNADSATNIGIEFDLYASLGSLGASESLPGFLRRVPWEDLYVGANYARIDSEIDLGDPGIQTNTVRPLQGQSKYVGNLSLSYLHPEGRTEAQLSYNVFGERISRVGINGLPDVYEQPFNQLDLTLSQALPWQGFFVKLRLRNLLDPEARFEQGGEATRAYRKGREAAISVEWKF